MLRYDERKLVRALDHYVIYRLGIEGEDQILAHPAVQAELARQDRDLRELMGAGSQTAKLVALLRGRARAEATIFFTDGR
jgi:hypothetical protein